MAVSYTNTLSTDLLVADIAGLMQWRDAVLRRALYPQAMMAPYARAQSALLEWCRRQGDVIDDKLVDRLQLVFNDLMRLGDEVAANAGAAVDEQVFDRLSQQLAAYIEQARYLHQQLADTAGAIDTLTGLRTPSGMRAEMKREQDRFDRKGTPFSIASIVIDSLGRLQETHDTSGMDAIYAGVAQGVAGVIRSFDDAYYMGAGEYLVILKHVEFMDACAAMDRLCGEVGRTAVTLPDGSRVPVTISIGVAEAQQREAPEGVVDHAKVACQQARAAGGNRVQEYHERSALEHFARDIHRDR